jgi:rhamnosyltransferase
MPRIGIDAINPDISIIIPVKNGIKVGIEKCLAGILSQTIQLKCEVIVIDSGSTDGTLNIIKSYQGIKLIQIFPEEFSHGGTRNLGARHAKGRYLVFINQDAWPVNDHWLDSLVKPLEEDDGVAGVYSRQLPKPDCYIYLERIITRSFLDKKIIKSKTKNQNVLDRYKGYSLYSTVSAAIRKQIWGKIPFDDQIAIGEDMLWAAKVLDLNYKIIYEPGSIVFHSHNWEPIEVFNRFYLSSKELNKTILFENITALEAVGGVIIRSVISIFEDVIYILFNKKLSFSRKIIEIMRSCESRPLLYIGMYFGRI